MLNKITVLSVFCSTCQNTFIIITTAIHEMLQIPSEMNDLYYVLF